MNQPLYPLHQAAGAERTGRKPLRRSSQLLPLEQRFMFDGAVAEAAHAAQVHDAAVAAAAVPPAVLVRAAEPAKDDGKKEVVLVDTSVANYKTLEAGIRAGIGIVEYDGSRDGLAQIAAWAATQNGLDAIHILSHGADGVLNLGTRQLTSAALASADTQAQLAELGRALNADGDLLLYGCDVADGNGAALLDGLALATGADIAASTDATGAARLGGNWTLEAQRGQIDSRSLALDGYDSLLTLVNTGPGNFPEGSTSFTKTVDGVTLTFTLGASSTVPGDTPGFWEDGPGFRPDTYIVGQQVDFTISVPAGFSFDLTQVNGLTEDTLVYRPTQADGSSKPNVSYTTQAPFTQEIYTLNGLSGMSQLRVTGSYYASFANFVINVHSLASSNTIASATLLHDSGVSGDYVTNYTGVNTINGTLTTALAANEKVQVSYDNGVQWNDATSYTVGSAVWSANTTLTGSGVFQARVVAVYGSDAFGNTSYTHNYQVDTSSPTISFSNVTLSTDNGKSGTDRITNVQAQTVKATLSGAPAAGDTVWASLNGGNTYVDVTSFVSGTTLTWTGRTLPVGSDTLMFKVSDLAGNESAPDSASYTIDITQPAITSSGLTLSNDTGTPADLITRTASQTLGGDLSATPLSTDTVYVSVANGAWAPATVSGSSWSLAGVTLAAGANTIRVKVTDLAGNDGSISSSNYTLDQTAPGIAISNIHISNDSNITTDFITNVASQTITATLGSTLGVSDVLYGSTDNGASWSNITSKVSGTTVTWTGATLTAGGGIQLKVGDNAGNDDSPATQTYTLDTSAPATPPTPVLATASDTGQSNSDRLTSDTTPTLSGTAESGSTVSVYDGATLLGSVVATGGAWSYTTGTLAGGSHSFTVTATDTAGNVSAPSNPLAVTIDATAPVVSTVAVPASAAYGSSATLSFTVHTDDIVYVDTSTGTPRLELTIGATTRYASYVSGSGSSSLVFSYAVQAGDSDSDGITVAGLSANGGKLADLAGNALDTTLHGVAPTAGVLVDTQAPTVTSVAVPADATYYTGNALEFTVNYNEAVYVNTSGGTPRIEITIGGTTRYASYVSGSGSSALLFRYTVVNGDSDADGISVGTMAANGGTLADGAGNAGTVALNSIGSTGGVLVDGSQPSVINVSSATPNGAYRQGQTITITVAFSAPVEVNTVGGSPTLSLSTGATATYLSGGGSSTLVFQYTVGAGENSADLDYASSAALAANGALIYESGGGGRNASLVLLAPGSAGSLGANRALVIDTLAPSATGSTLVLSEDTGSSLTDRITYQSQQTDIHGTLSATLNSGEFVQVSLDNGASWLTATTNGSNWSIGARTLSGSNTALVRVQDAAGNLGNSTQFTYVLDQAGPTTSFGSIGFSDDSGVSDSDLITNVAAQTITATLSVAPAAGEKVFGSLDGGATWSEITSKVSGTALSWDNVTLAASNQLQFYVRDVAGNDGSVTSTAYVLDTTQPGTTVASAGLSADTGASNSDFITKTGSQTINGTLSANLAAGEMVYVSTDGGTSWALATSDGLDGWSIAGRTLTAGNDTLLVKVTDTAGNDGPVYSKGYTYDTTPPAAATVTPLQTPSLTPVLSGSATLTAGDTLQVSVGGATYDVTPVAGAWTLDLATAVPASGALTLVLNTQYNVVATVTDAAGNSSNDATSGELIVGTLAQPATPPTTSASGAALSQDSGASNSDLITNVAQQTISGSLSAPLLASERVEVSLDGGVTWSSASASASGSSWSINATLAASGTLQVRVSGDGGTGPVYSHAYTLDTTPPAAPAADALSTSTLTPQLSGSATLADGDTLRVSVGGADYAVSVANGRWRLDLASATPLSGTLALAAGNRYTVVATVTDLAGNRSSGSATLNVNALPAVTGMALSADSGSSNSDFITNVAAQTVSGSLSAPLAAGQTVQVSRDGGASWQDAAVSGTSWSASLTLSGSNTLVARVASADGNGAALQRAYVLDTSAPLATPTLLTQTADGTASGALSAPLGAGETVHLSRDGGATWSALSLGGPSWSLNLNGASSMLLQVRDTAGNAGATLTVNASDTPQEPQPPQEPPPPVRPEPPLVLDTPQPPAPAGPGTDNTPASGTPGEPPVVAPVVLPPVSGNDIVTTWPGQTPPTVTDTLPAYVALQPMAEIRAPAANVFQIITLPDLPGGNTLVAYTPIPDVRSASGDSISVQISSDAFAHASDSASVTLSAQMVDGKALPGWLRFDGRTARFEGTPPLGFEGTLSFRVTARDSQGRIATQVFKIVVTKDGAKTSYWQGEPAEPAGRASLGEQMRSARSSAAARLVALSS